jgi:hypothetical protein
MFNSDVKDRAFQRLKKANENYQAVVTKVTDSAGELHKLRENASKKVILAAEVYVNRLANSPKEFEKSVKELRISFERFEEECRKVFGGDNVAAVGGTAVGTGVAAGVGVAAFAPTAAIAIATTFGTASTGTAISALGGAAATNAALAWLGGGALAAGGGGMAAGNALLALAGPVGWAIGGTALIGGAFWVNKKNKDLAEKATSSALDIEKKAAALKSANVEIGKLHSLTELHSTGAMNQLDHLKKQAPADYTSFAQGQKLELGALINNIQSLSKLLVRNVG